MMKLLADAQNSVSIKHEAVRVLSILESRDDIVQADPIKYAPQSLEDFEANEEVYITAWQTWWEQHGRAKYMDIIEVDI
jgi:hypothetical protein